MDKLDILKINEDLVALAFLAVLSLGLLGVFFALNSYKCSAQWERSGLRSDYGLIQGCMVERKDGTWVPAETLREVSP